MTESEYRTHSGVNWSTLKRMTESPLAYRSAIDTPQADSPAFMLGRAVHCLTLEPAEFEARFSVYEGTRRGKEWEKFSEENSARDILTGTEYSFARAISTAVLSNRVARGYIERSIIERPLFWTDKDTSIECKARPDMVIPDAGVLADLKTTRSIDPRRIGAECARYLYPHQLAHYAQGCRLSSEGWEPSRAILIFVEKTAPYDVGVFEVPQLALDVARDEVAALLSRLAECRASGRWPGRYETEQTLELPTYFYGGEMEVSFVDD
jgi:exodeoxyribonuclease VIII